MRTVLVTGPIGGGKSAACRYLASKGIPVYDSDSRTKALYGSVPGLKALIEKELDIRFEELAIIFTDPERKRRLEDIVYPLVAEDIRRWKSGQDSEVVAVESANALGNPLFDGLFDSVLLVTAPLETRIARNPKAASRSSLQHFENVRADWTVVNDGTKEELYKKLDTLAL